MKIYSCFIKSGLSLILIIFFRQITISQNPRDNFFAKLIYTVNITFADSIWYDTLSDNFHKYNWKGKSCNVLVDRIELKNVGIRFRGNSSFSHPNKKKSFRLDFNKFAKGQRLDGLKQLNLNNSYSDPTFLREKLYLDFCNSNDLDAPRCVYANVYVNNQLWGFYTLIEEVDKIFLETHYGNKDGDLYKSIGGNLEYLGPDGTSYHKWYELKTNKEENNFTDLINFTDKINNTPSAF